MKGPRKRQLLHSPSGFDWRLLQGVAFVLFLACALDFPPLRRWPWLWLAPLVPYLLLVMGIPPIRRSLGWFRLGRLSIGAVVATMGIMVLTISALIAFSTIVRPDVMSRRNLLPICAMGGSVVAGVLFTTTNAILEELVFRGVLFDAVRSQWDTRSTLVGTAILFGLGHLHGYPPGLIGACLATVFGFGAGVLRFWTGGLLLPIVAHMGADATIFSILVHSGGA
jgi:membrane protease YdiL (CAAX protease family)